MNKLLSSIRSFAIEEDGAQVIEYALIIAVVSIALILLMMNGFTFQAWIDRVNTCLDGTAYLRLIGFRLNGSVHLGLAHSVHPNQYHRHQSEAPSCAKLLDVIANKARSSSPSPCSCFSCWGSSGFALDFGRLFVVKSELQTAMDSCALAAAQELDLQPTAIERATSAGLTAGNLNRGQSSSRRPGAATRPGLLRLRRGALPDDRQITFKDPAYLPTTNPALAQYVAVPARPVRGAGCG